MPALSISKLAGLPCVNLPFLGRSHTLVLRSSHAPPSRIKKEINFSVYHSSGHTASFAAQRREMWDGKSLSFTAPRFLTRGAARRSVRWGRTFSLFHARRIDVDLTSRRRRVPGGNVIAEFLEVLFSCWQLTKNNWKSRLRDEKTNKVGYFQQIFQDVSLSDYKEP